MSKIKLLLLLLIFGIGCGMLFQNCNQKTSSLNSIQKVLIEYELEQLELELDDLKQQLSTTETTEKTYIEIDSITNAIKVFENKLIEINKKTN